MITQLWFSSFSMRGRNTRQYLLKSRRQTGFKKSRMPRIFRAEYLKGESSTQKEVWDLLNCYLSTDLNMHENKLVKSREINARNKQAKQLLWSHSAWKSLSSHQEQKGFITHTMYSPKKLTALLLGLNYPLLKGCS